jgi:hypothetical protein
MRLQQIQHLIQFIRVEVLAILITSIGFQLVSDSDAYVKALVVGEMDMSRLMLMICENDDDPHAGFLGHKR